MVIQKTGVVEVAKVEGVVVPSVRVLLAARNTHSGSIAVAVERANCAPVELANSAGHTGVEVPMPSPFALLK